MTAVTELFMREMSPSQFCARFGGGSVATVERHFQVLVKYGWLRRLMTTPGAGGRGTQAIYRATELAVFDDETWALLPYPMRVTISSFTYKQLSDRIHEALVAGTFDSREDRHFSWTPILLDQEGWERVIAAVNARFESLALEQEDAKLRRFHSNERPFRATVGLALFESPFSPGPAIWEANLPETDEDLSKSTPYLLSKVLDDPLCQRLVWEGTLREISAPMIASQFSDASLQTIRRRCKMLESLGWLRSTEAKRSGHRRGGTEQFYRATRPAVFDNKTWAEVPDWAKGRYSWTTFRDLSEQIELAAAAGTLDGRDDRHLSWSLMTLDELGWKRIRKSLDGLFNLLPREQRKAKERMASSGESPVKVTAAIALFESPGGGN
ncbi:MAG TPA: hypothetical protein VEQ41_02175 [Solirubrobacterales bacterium]|nr:hypothetical protein [Solirubrobacterales bacterium]